MINRKKEAIQGNCDSRGNVAVMQLNLREKLTTGI